MIHVVEMARALVRMGILLRGLTTATRSLSTSQCAENTTAIASMPTAGMAEWRQIELTEKPLGRSSHGVSFNPVDGYVYCWGGEHVARHAIDNTGPYPFPLPSESCWLQSGASIPLSNNTSNLYS